MNKLLSLVGIAIVTCLSAVDICVADPVNSKQVNSEVRIQRLASANPNWFGMLYFYPPKSDSKLRCVRFLRDDSWELAEETEPGLCDKIISTGKLRVDGEVFVADGLPLEQLADSKKLWKAGHVNIWVNQEEVDGVPKRVKE